LTKKRAGIEKGIKEEPSKELSASMQTTSKPISPRTKTIPNLPSFSKAPFKKSSKIEPL